MSPAVVDVIDHVVESREMIAAHGTAAARSDANIQEHYNAMMFKLQELSDEDKMELAAVVCALDMLVDHLHGMLEGAVNGSDELGGYGVN